MLPNWTVCAIQFDTKYQDPEENTRRMEEKIRAAVREKPDLIVLPELWTSGYSVEIFHDIQKFAQPETGPAVSMLKRMAKEYGVYIVGGSAKAMWPADTARCICTTLWMKMWLLRLVMKCRFFRPISAKLRS